jgi:hypothetical protein
MVSVMIMGGVFLLSIPLSYPIKCMVGYGQRGRLHMNGIQWPRNCIDSTYCWGASTTDMTIMQRLFTFHWDEYYSKYYVTACGGEFGTEIKVSPKQKFNLSAPIDIRGKGGVELMNLDYSCNKDFCSNALRNIVWNIPLILVSLTIMIILNFPLN